MPHAAGRVRGRRRRRAHGLVRRAGGDGRGGGRGQRAARGHHLQGQGRARTGAGRRGGARGPRRAARRRPLRRRQPRLELRRRGAGGRRARRARGAGDRGADLDRRSRRPAAARRALGRAAGRRRELHQPRARRSRARGGRGPGREHQDGADRLHGVAPDPRSLPRPQRRRWSSAASTRARSAPSATIAFAAAFAATAGQPAEITNFLDLADDLVVAGPEIRDGRAAVPAGAGPRRRGRRGAPRSATGWTADAVHGRDGGPPAARHAGRAGGRAQGARARVLAGALSATGAGRICGGWPAATRT